MASSSLAALLVGSGAPAAFAQCAISPGTNQSSVSNSAAINCINIQGIAVTGNVINTGPPNTGIITPTGFAPPTRTGITINSASVGGAIVNAGQITAPTSGDGIVVTNNATVSGGISNSGQITATTYADGIVVTNNAAVFGGISNSGTISAGHGQFVNGILIGGNAVTSHTTVTIATFAGGISNSGMISMGSGNAILVGGDDANANIAAFSGGISNSGMISTPGSGIFVGGDEPSAVADTITISTFAGGISNSGTIAAGKGIFVGGTASRGQITISTFTGGISNSGMISANGDGIFVGGTALLSSTVTISTFAGGISNSGVISARGNGIFVGSPFMEIGGAFIVSTFAGGISNSGTISAGTSANGIFVGGYAQPGSSITISTFSGGISNSGLISAGHRGIFVGGTASGGASVTISTFAGGISNSGTIIAQTGIVVDHVATFLGAIVNSGTITGTAGTAIDISGAPNGMTVDILGGAISGNILGAGTTSGDTVNFALGSGSFAYANTIAGMQAVNINSGTLFDSGSITAAGVVVNSGGTLAPGLPNTTGTLTIAGNLSFNGGDYEIQLTPSAHASATVSGSLAIGNGTVALSPSGPLGTHYSATTFSILTYGGTLTGAFNPNVIYTGAVALSNKPTISYVPGNVDLSYGNAIADLTTPPGASQNQQNVINGINTAILAGDTIPPGFQGLVGLGGAALLNAYSQLDGEDATGASTSTFQLFNGFFNLLSDIALGTGGGGGASPGSGATGFAEPDAAFPPELALAYNRVLRKNTAQQSAPQSFDQRWTAWGSAYGGAANYNGNAAIGSNNLAASDFGFAGGMDYHAAPDLKLGFALAGGGTNWSLAQNLGGGRSDAVQIAGYGIKHYGPLYFTAMAAFGNSWFTTNRVAAFGDQLRASFDGQSYGLRGESGYRFAVTPMSGITPYAAVQTQWFHTPGYSETDLTGGGFGLTFNSQTANNTRSELGARADDLMTIDTMPLILRARVAWAHDWVSNAALGAVFQALPGAAFTVNGAAVPANSALLSAGGQLFFSPHWSVEAKFDSEFASSAQTYAGTGTLRYTW
ncbi:MAG: autotransporter domain-containing protein [Xanthobacteraceae bacterium]